MLSAKIPTLVRRLATTSSFILDRQSQKYNVFDRNAKRMQKDRAAAREGGNRNRRVDYIFDEVADRLAERLMVSAFSITIFFLWPLILTLHLAGYKTQFSSYFGHWQWCGLSS
jgi:hypothetical protein